MSKIDCYRSYPGEQSGPFAIGYFGFAYYQENQDKLTALYRRERNIYSISIGILNSTTSPVTVKITRSQILVTRSAVRSRLCAAHIR